MNKTCSVNTGRRAQRKRFIGILCKEENVIHMRISIQLIGIVLNPHYQNLQVGQGC